jgi:acyl-coenzyme A thioesterase PaaI-like protein
MKVTEIPFNRFLKIKTAEEASSTLLELTPASEHLNHVGTVHAGVQLSLAEAASGEFFLRTLPGFSDQVYGVLRRVEAKFKNPMKGKIFARAVTTAIEVTTASEILLAKGRAIIPVAIEVVDAEGIVGLQATFQWYIQMNENS